MSKWVLKAVVQKLFGIVPGGFKLNYLFQKYVSGAVRLSEEFFETMLTHTNEMLEYGVKHKFSFKGIRVFEIGTGWHPVVPMALWLSGAEKVLTVDLNPHLRMENLKVLIQKFITYHDSGKLREFLPSVDEDKIQVLRGITETGTKSINAVLSECGIEQQITDAANTNFADHSFDLCYSVNVFEHIDKALIPGITEELSRISKRQALGYHAIGVYDHFTHIDNSISKFNYLRFSENQWKLIDNTIQPQNRLRISYFRELFKKMHFMVLDEILQPAEPEELKRVPVHPDFRDVTDADIPYGTFILKRD